MLEMACPQECMSSHHSFAFIPEFFVSLNRPASFYEHSRLLGQNTNILKKYKTLVQKDASMSRFPIAENLNYLGLLACVLLVCGCSTSNLANAQNPASQTQKDTSSSCCAGSSSASCCDGSSSAGCSSCDQAGIDITAKPTVTIRWKRLVDANTARTAPAHLAAEKELDAAIATLKASLQPMGVDVVVQKVALSHEQFVKDPTRSNRIWINGAAIEMYLPEGKSEVQQDTQTSLPYRTVEFAGASFRDVPQQMIVKAGLIAAGDSVKQSLEDIRLVGLNGNANSSCCSPNQTTTGSTCCPTKGKESSCCKPGAGSCAGGSCGTAPASKTGK